MAKADLNQPGANERSPLLASGRTDEASTSYRHKHDHNMKGNVPTNVAYRLYISHFLSTWNSRVFEFGSVLYLASIYPGTLMPMSIYALSRGLAAIIFAPAVGYYIDVGNRLHVVRISIVFQRFVVVTSCAIFYVLAVRPPLSPTTNKLLATLALLACIEKLTSVMNMVSVERDWVVVVAGKDHESLKVMNAQMRRIDLICKLIGPLCIALVDGISTKNAILVNLVMNIISVVVEYFSIAQVYDRVPALQERKALREDESRPASRRFNLSGACINLFRRSWEDFSSYFQHPLFIPSFAGALLYLTVLSFGGQMVTWLVSTGYDSTQVAVARTMSVIFEMLATWIAPWLMGKIGPVRAGIWLSTWQIACLAGGTAVFWKFSNDPLVSASGLVGGTILSRVGLRGFDLCSQILVQEGVEGPSRGSFSSVEAAWQNLFEICSYLCTIIFVRPEQFKWPALISLVAVCVAGSLYAIFVRMKRGHLVHLPGFFTGDDKHVRREQGMGSSSDDCLPSC